MYPQSAIEALNFLKAQPDCDFVEFSIARECYGSIPYLYGKTKEGQWCIVWHPDELND
jgi:hypothetical protein